MKKFLFLISLMFLFIPDVFGKDLNVYLFYGEGCSHCAALEDYLNTKDNINVYKYEVWFNSDNETLLNEVAKITGVEPKGVPYYIIGKDTLQGYNDTQSWKETIDKRIEKALTEEYTDEVGIYLGKLEKEEIVEENSTNLLVETKEEKDNKKVIITIIVIAIIDIVATAIYLYKNKKKKL